MSVLRTGALLAAGVATGRAVARMLEDWRRDEPRNPRGRTERDGAAEPSAPGPG